MNVCEEETSDVLLSKVEISFKLTTKTRCGVKFGKDVCVRIKRQVLCVECVCHVCVIIFITVCLYVFILIILDSQTQNTF